MNEFLKMMLKNLPVGVLLTIVVPLVCNKVGKDLKSKDANDFGKDDAAGNLFITFGTAFASYDEQNENAFRKALKITRDAIDKYLSERPVPEILIEQNRN